MEPQEKETELEQESPFIYGEDDILEEPTSWDLDDFDDILDFDTDF